VFAIDFGGRVRHPLSSDAIFMNLIVDYRVISSLYSALAAFLASSDCFKLWSQPISAVFVAVPPISSLRSYVCCVTVVFVQGVVSPPPLAVRLGLTIVLIFVTLLISGWFAAYERHDDHQ
jgi:hypothetical protein